MDEIITRLFVMVDDGLRDVKRPDDASLYPSEVVTSGLLFSLKGGKFRRFYRWLEQNYRHLFPAPTSAPGCSGCWSAMKR